MECGQRGGRGRQNSPRTEAVMDQIRLNESWGENESRAQQNTEKLIPPGWPTGGSGPQICCGLSLVFTPESSAGIRVQVSDEQGILLREAGAAGLEPRTSQSVPGARHGDCVGEEGGWECPPLEGSGSWVRGSVMRQQR